MLFLLLSLISNGLNTNSNANEIVCVAQQKIKATYLASFKSYLVSCSDGTNEATKREGRALYIPTGQAEEHLKNYMSKKGLKQVGSIALTSSKNKWSKNDQDQDVLVFSNQSSPSEWGFIRRNKGVVSGPGNIELYDFEAAYQHSSGVLQSFKGYSEVEFKEYIKQNGYIETFRSSQSGLCYSCSIHVLKKQK